MNKRYRRNVAAVLSVGLLCACTAYWDETEENGVMYHLSRSGKEAFASEYTWDVHGDETEIIIPDEVNGAKVTQLGGYFGTGVPSPFCVLPSESGFRCDALLFPVLRNRFRYSLLFVHS